MDNTGTGVISYVGGLNHAETVVGSASTLKIFKKWLVLDADKFGAKHRFNNGVLFHLALFDDVGKTVLEANIVLLGRIIHEANIGEGGVHCEGQIAGQSPWRGCPGDKTAIRVRKHRKSDDNGGVRDIFVV